MKSSRNGKVVGVFPKDEYTGDFADGWKSSLSSEKFENVDIGASIAYIMAPKEEPELLTMKKACLVSVDIFGKHLKEQILEIIDAEKVRIFNSIALLSFALPLFFFVHLFRE